LNNIQFNIPLPIAALLVFICGTIYTLWKFHQIVKSINLNKADSVHQAYRNFKLPNGRNYASLDPEREMERLATNWVVRLYSRKNANLIYARILDCIEKNRFMINSMTIDETISKNLSFKSSYLNNIKLYFFLIDILQLNNRDRIEAFNKFKGNSFFIYDNENGYFKEYTTLAYNKT